MPELPEVETTLRGIEPYLRGRRITAIAVREPRLRWPVPAALARAARGQLVRSAVRRGKYLLIELERGTLILHLGMSGSLRVLGAATPIVAHDHVDIVLDSGQLLRFNDPRRFGALLWTTTDPRDHPLLARLAPEPLEPQFDTEYLFRATRRRKVAIKQFLMNSQVVVGVGNIYASEALFRARIDPRLAAGRLTRLAAARLVRAIKTVLAYAIRQGGTTLRDYVGADGAPGYFRQKLFVYERAGLPCRRCRTPIRHIVQGARSTYFCVNCQRRQRKVAGKDGVRRKRRLS